MARHFSIMFFKMCLTDLQSKINFFSLESLLYKYLTNERLIKQNVLSMRRIFRKGHNNKNWDHITH